MPSRAESRQWAAILATWNRKLHYYLALYFLFFIWLFALSGLLLNHGGWTFAQFYPNRKVSTLERAIDTPASMSDLEQARRSCTTECGTSCKLPNNSLKYALPCSRSLL